MRRIFTTTVILNILIFLSGTYNFSNAEEENISSEKQTTEPWIIITKNAKEELQKISKGKPPKHPVMNIIYLREE